MAYGFSIRKWASSIVNYLTLGLVSSCMYVFHLPIYYLITVLGMDDVDILVCDYCETNISRLLPYIHSIYSENCLQTCQTVHKCV